MNARELTWEEFEREFRPIKNYLAADAPLDGTMFETYGDEMEFVKNSSNSHPGTVWTFMDDGKGGTMIGDGLHFVNRLGYVVTEVPAEPGVTYVIDHDTEDDLTARSEEIKADYLASGCQRSDLDEAVNRLVGECGDLFSDEEAAWRFLMEEPAPETESNPAMMVSLDGGVTYIPAPSGVRIIYGDVMIDGEDGRGEVHVNATHEGIVTDIWTSREGEDHNIGTDSVFIDDIVARLVEENS